MPAQLNYTFEAQVRRPNMLPRIQMVLESRADSTTLRANYALLVAAFDFMSELRDIVRAQDLGQHCQMRSLDPGSHELIVRDGGDGIVFYALIGFDEDKDIFEARRLHFTVDYWGSHEAVRAVAKAMDDKYGRARLASIEWHYMIGPEPDYRHITMQPPQPVYDSFYPWVAEPIDEYAKRYLASTASVLFLMGAPGTGKTSLLRHIIYTHHLKALVTYEQQILNSDSMFANFLAGGEDAILVIEDSESLVGKREVGDGNTMMTRFLNVSDGLVQLGGKKIVFTTNQNDFRGVDQALLRPGRCFDVLKARGLTYPEACQAARDAGLPRPADTGQPILLTDLFNPPQSQAIEGIGFGVGVGR